MALFLLPLTSSLDTLGTHLDAILALVGIVVLLFGLWKKSVGWSQKIEALDALAQHELNHNSGTSVKDKAYAAADLSQKALEQATEASKAAKEAAAGVGVLQRQFAEYLTASARERAAMWIAIGGRDDHTKQDPAA